jgi:hypothetical protein
VQPHATADAQRSIALCAIGDPLGTCLVVRVDPADAKLNGVIPHIPITLIAIHERKDYVCGRFIPMTGSRVKDGEIGDARLWEETVGGRGL